MKTAKPAKDGKKGTPSDDKKKDRRMWTDDETNEALEYLCDTIRSGFSIEKPNATAYYGTAIGK